MGSRLVMGCKPLRSVDEELLGVPLLLTPLSLRVPLNFRDNFWIRPIAVMKLLD
jgi:hypothetical protein